MARPESSCSAAWDGLVRFSDGASLFMDTVCIVGARARTLVDRLACSPRPCFGNVEDMTAHTHREREAAVLPFWQCMHHCRECLRWGVLRIAALPLIMLSVFSPLGWETGCHTRLVVSSLPFQGCVRDGCPCCGSLVLAFARYW